MVAGPPGICGERVFTNTHTASAVGWERPESHQPIATITRLRLMPDWIAVAATPISMRSRALASSAPAS